MITAIRVKAAAGRPLNPDADVWGRAREEALTLEPTPLSAQPSGYVRAAWKDRPHGATRELGVAAAHNGRTIFFRLRWRDESPDEAISDTDRFPDAAAVLFPLRNEAPLASMGSPEQPVNAWLWRPDLERPLNVTATGLGTTVRHPDGALEAGARHADGEWAVVISRPFAAGGDAAAPLAPGRRRQVAFAVWQGSNQERAGLKAATLEWQPLEIEA